MGEKVTVREVQQKTMELERRMDGVDDKLDEMVEGMKTLQHNNDEMRDNIQRILSSMGEFVNQRQSTVEEIPKEDKAESKPSYVQEAKLSFPTFDGSDFRNWRDRCEQFFSLEDTAEEQRLKLLILSMEGKAFAWQKNFFRLTEKSSINWKEFMKAVGRRFDTSCFEDPMAELVNLKQIGNLTDYLEKFDELIARTSVDEQTALSCFLGGLKKPLEKAIRLQNPQTVNNAMAMARVQDELLLELSLQSYHVTSGRHQESADSQGNFNSYSYNKFQKSKLMQSVNSFSSIQNSGPNKYSTEKVSQNQGVNSRTASTTGSVGPPSGQKQNFKGIKEVTGSEMSSRMARGLCKFCGEKFDFNHKNVCRVWGRLNALWAELDEENVGLAESMEEPRDEEIDHHLEEATKEKRQGYYRDVDSMAPYKS